MPDVIEIEIRRHAERRIDPGAVLTLYGLEGWWPERTSLQLATVLESGPAVGAWAGIGQSLTEHLLQFVPATAMTSLFCAEPLTALYAASGFRPTAQIVMHHQPAP